MAKKKSKKKHKKVHKPAAQVTQATSTKKKQAVKQSVTKKSAKAKAAPAETSVASSTTSKSKGVLLIIGLVIIVLVGIMLFFYGQAQLVRDKAANTGQDDLLKVQPAAGDSLQPTDGTNSNPQQTAPSTQGSSTDSSTLQPNTPSQDTGQPSQ